uniref:Uncharacterized protein n=1 Tax=Chlamydomonas euryale TaxID=1486919 RepID=A0A7R9VIX0_9CHLO|mmetsp:Transcript_35289/g.104389  ORF Transcript_35289/g.104389 Transcript_35289/m.104389 type:complete len:444 (+) Transcript_35289:242-1573(+)|eukprot:364263-Chlamydomonas_euryale.AAC.4
MALLRRLLRPCWTSEAHGCCVDEELQTIVVAAEERADERRRSLTNSASSGRGQSLPCVPQPSCPPLNILSNPHPRPLLRMDARPPSSPFAACTGAAPALELVRRGGSPSWRHKIAAYAALASASTRAVSRAKKISLVWHASSGHAAGDTAQISRDVFSADALLVVGDISGGGRDGSSDGDERASGALLDDVPPALMAGLLQTYGGIDSAVAALKRADSSSSPRGHLVQLATGMVPTNPASRQFGADLNSEPLASCRQLAEQAPRERGPVSGPTSPAQMRQLFSDRLMRRFELSQRQPLQQVLQQQTLCMAILPRPCATVEDNVGSIVADTANAVDISAAAVAPNQPGNECSFSHTNFEHMRNGPLMISKTISCSERLSGSQAMARMQKVVDFYSGGGYNLMEGVVERVRARNVNELDLARGEMEAVLRRMRIDSDCQVVRHVG